MELIILIFSVTVLSVNQICGEPSDYVEEVLKEIYKEASISKENNGPGGVRESMFLTDTFSRLASLIPDSVELPRYIENIGRSGYLCTSETAVSLKVRGTTSNLSFRPYSLKGYVGAVFQADLIFQKPVIFETFMEEYNGEEKTFCDVSSRTGTVQNTFNKEIYANFSVAVSELPKDQKTLQIPECVVYIISISVATVGTPVVREIDNSFKGIGERLWNSLQGHDINTMMSMGIMRALRGKVQPVSNRMQGEEWVCLDYELSDYNINPEGPEGKITYRKRNPLEFISIFQHGIENSIFTSNSQNDPDKSDDTVVVQMSDSVSGRVKQFSVAAFVPLTFRKLRNLSGTEEAFYLKFFCQDILKPLANPGKSGASLYISPNRRFIAKMSNSSDVATLLNFVQAYLTHVRTNPDTLLPKFFGLYTYKQLKRILIGDKLNMVVMNNIMPANLEIISQAYDLKGSTFNRDASKKEKEKKFATFRDNDFRFHHSHGIYLKEEDYNKVMKAVASDSKFLLDFSIIDYSLLLGISYGDVLLDKYERDRPSGEVTCVPCDPKYGQETTTENKEEEHVFPKGIRAMTANGETVTLYMGIIDVLQVFNLRKRIESFAKGTLIWDYSFSVVKPTTYSTRFVDFIGTKVFKKMLPCQTGMTKLSARQKLKKWYKCDPVQPPEPTKTNGLFAKIYEALLYFIKRCLTDYNH